MEVFWYLEMLNKKLTEIRDILLKLPKKYLTTFDVASAPHTYFVIN